MKKTTSCAECESIALEYREACVAFWLNASEETRDACRAILRLAAGVEPDLARVEEHCRPFRPEESHRLESKGSPPTAEAIRRKYRHQALTGYHVNFRGSKS